MTTTNRNIPMSADRVSREREDERLNRDPISGKPGAHPVGTGVGAAAGGAAGAGIGAVAGGPVGAAIGGVAGAIAGGLVGKGAAEQLDPTEEETYWRGVYDSRPYADPTLTYDDYAPAYRYGWESWTKRMDSRKTFDDLESELRAGWDRSKAKTRIGWDKAKDAVRDSWQRVAERFGPEDLRADDDGMAPDKARVGKTPVKAVDGKAGGDCCSR